MNEKHIKRAGDQPVRHPNGTPLSDKVEAVAWGPYWQRRLEDGDIEIVDVRQKGDQ